MTLLHADLVRDIVIARNLHRYGLTDRAELRLAAVAGRVADLFAGRPSLAAAYLETLLRDADDIFANLQKIAH
jgi:hypothetical protein